VAWVGGIGIAMATLGLIAILIELALIVPRALRLNSLLAQLVAFIDQTQATLESDLGDLRTAGHETHVLWRPYRRVVRWLTNPLTIALFESYRRRSARKGIDRQGNQASPVDRVAR